MAMIFNKPTKKPPLTGAVQIVGFSNGLVLGLARSAAALIGFLAGRITALGVFVGLAVLRVICGSGFGGFRFAAAADGQGSQSESCCDGNNGFFHVWILFA